MNSNSTNNRTVRPPPYAILALILFGLSLGALAFAAWLAFRGADEPQYRRGFTALTEETNLGKIWQADARLEHRLAPNVNVTFDNEDGETVHYRSINVGGGEACFRDDGIDGPVFAVAVGDSFTFGHANTLDATWVEQVEKGIAGEVVNLGVTNIYGSTQILRTLEQYGLPLKPKVILWAAFVNDWYEDTVFLSWEKIAQPLKGQLDFPRSRPVYDAIRRSIYLKATGEAGGGLRNPALDARTMYESGGLKLEFDATSYAAQDLTIPSIANGWGTTREALSKAKELAKSIGAEFVVLPIPAKEHVYHDRVCTVIEYANSQTPDAFCAAYEAFCEENGIRCLNPYGPLRDKGRRGEKLFFTEDGHFNRAGNAALAELIVEYLNKSGITPAVHARSTPASGAGS